MNARIASQVSALSSSSNNNNNKNKNNNNNYVDKAWLTSKAEEERRW